MKTKWLRLWSGLGVYAAAVCGVLFSKYLPELLRSQDISAIKLAWPSISEFVIALGLAAFVVSKTENDKNLTPEEREAAAAGKMKRIKRRLFNGFTYGVGCFYLLKAFFERWAG